MDQSNSEGHRIFDFKKKDCYNIYFKHYNYISIDSKYCELYNKEYFSQEFRMSDV